MKNERRKVPRHSTGLSNHWKIVLAILLCIALVEFGCTTANTTSYPYRAITNDCNCQEYHAADSKNHIGYIFRAQYRMDDGIVTSIEVEFTNNSHTDTLSFDHSAVKISSRNISYQYNDKFLPIPLTVIPPRNSDHVKMSGREITGVEDWHKIAGEQLTVTVKGLRLGTKELPQQAVTFIPQNPKLGRE